MINEPKNFPSFFPHPSRVHDSRLESLKIFSQQKDSILISILNLAYISSSDGMHTMG